MSITASCGNCGKTYQAPDRMAGKSVRCKQCGEVFRIDAGDVGGIDLDALDQSVSGEDLATHHATAMGTRAGTRMGTRAGPALDEHGRARIERPDDVEAFAISGAHAPGFRSNYRFRYPGAKAVDQFLPFVLVLLTLLLLTNACLNNEASTDTTVGQTPSTGVAIGRLAMLLAAYLFVIWPASHLALRMASVKTRFSMPSYAIWRSFAAFTPVVLMGGFLFVQSGGAGVALAMGLIVGVALAVGAVSLLFRVFANEVPTVAAYIGVGSLGSAIFAALAIVAINMIAVALARLDKNPTLFVSPIAIGLPWVDKPAPVIIAKKPSVKPSAPATQSKAPETAVAVVPPVATPVQPLQIPAVDPSETLLLKSLGQTPIAAGFDEIVMPLVKSSAMVVIRNSAGGVAEVWDDAAWRQPTSQVVRGFERAQGELFVNTVARDIFRLTHYPSDRLEQMPLGNMKTRNPIRLAAASNRKALGFLNESTVLLRSSAGGLTLETCDVTIPEASTKPTALNKLGGGALQVDLSGHTLRVLPDGSGVVVAYRDGEGHLAHYPIGDSQPDATRDVESGSDFLPLGLAVRSSGRTALLQDTNGECYLSIWEFLSSQKNGVTIAPDKEATLDHRIGVRRNLQPQAWEDTKDPLVWIDEDTLLVYGSVVIDARSGIRLGTLNIPNVIAAYSLRDGEVGLIQRVSNLNTLLVATFDPAALNKARGN